MVAMATLGTALVATGSGAAMEPSSVLIPQLTLSGANEVPAVDVNAVGYFSARVWPDRVEFDLSADGDQFTQAHIHLGAAGTNGPVIAFLYGPNETGEQAIHPTGVITVDNLVGPLKGDWAGFVAALAKGDLYVNAHSIDHPAGVIRAQIPATVAPPAAATATPPAPPTATPAPPKTGTGLADASSSGMGWAMGLGIALVSLAAAGLTLAAVTRRR
jgi:hypothetical protein